MWTSVPHGYASFLPQALLPFCQRTEENFKIYIPFQFIIITFAKMISIAFLPDYNMAEEQTETLTRDPAN